MNGEAKQGVYRLNCFSFFVAGRFWLWADTDGYHGRFDAVHGLSYHDIN